MSSGPPWHKTAAWETGQARQGRKGNAACRRSMDAQGVGWDGSEAPGKKGGEKKLNPKSSEEGNGLGRGKQKQKAKVDRPEPVLKACGSCSCGQEVHSGR